MIIICPNKGKTRRTMSAHPRKVVDRILLRRIKENEEQLRVQERTFNRGASNENGKGGNDKHGKQKDNGNHIF